MKQQAPRQECRTGESCISSLANPLAVGKGEWLATRGKTEYPLANSLIVPQSRVESVAKRKFFTCWESNPVILRTFSFVHGSKHAAAGTFNMPCQNHSKYRMWLGTVLKNILLCF
jgi:hypothetical protein